MSRLPGARVHTLEDPLALEYGGRLNVVDVAFETLGELNADRSNAVMIVPAFSAHSHVASHRADPSPGWWEKVVGRGRAIDTDKWFVVCPSLLGTCSGTTGPRSIDPTTGEVFGAKFPVVTTRDLVDLHARLLDHLDVPELHAVVGGSFGAMQVLEFLVRHPGRAMNAFAISGTDFTRPYTAAIRHIGRRAIMIDPGYRDGNYGDDPPGEGLRLAREIGTLYYRSREEFNARFGHEPLHEPAIGEVVFDVQSYLDHQGRKAIGKFDPNAYLVMSLAMDLHDVGRDFDSVEAAYSCVTANVTVVGVAEDRLIPVDEQRATHDSLTAAGAAAEWREVHSKIGHDAFLGEVDMMNDLLEEFLG